eukprot:TRINITY_DN45368_c0_g1_i1.p1 TRINITY_DN45368_c0_g1~~TRINITY_DN45368_c0_g1_i1.p1  ORF type:complete len:885 (+),score=88.88 TRINITY_DN45368_c0_g1_i1:45-2699(+)
MHHGSTRANYIGESQSTSHTEPVVSEVLKWSDAEVSSLLQRVRRSRPYLLRDHTPEASQQHFGKSAAQAASNEPSPSSVLSPADVTIVQFSTSIYYCSEAELIVDIDIMRFGNVNCRSEVNYTTRDGTALAGKRYHHQEGTLVFEPGEREQVVKIHLIATNEWATTLEFRIELLPDTLINAQLGNYLYFCRVQVIDETCFPSDKYRRLIHAEKFDQMPPWHLMYEYIKFNWSNPIVRKGGIKMFLSDQLDNLYFVMKLFLNVQMIDYALNLAVDESSLPTRSRSLELAAIILTTILPFFVLHYLGYSRPGWKVAGASRLVLQKSLVRKFLNYAPNVRSKVGDGELIMAIARDSVNLVEVGFCGFFVLLKIVGQLFAILLYQVVAPYAFARKIQPLAFSPSVVLPLILFPFLLCRKKQTVSYDIARSHKQDALVDRVTRTAANYRLIADYTQRPYYVAWFERTIQEYNVAFVHAAQVKTNNQFCAPWVTLILVGVYTYIGGTAVIRNSQSLGMFITNLEVFKAIGAAYAQLYDVVLDVQHSFDSLFRIVQLLNSNIDVPQRHALGRNRRALTKKFRAEALAANPDTPVALDLLPISMERMNFKYEHAGGPRQPMLGVNKGSLNIPQGQLVSIMGEGKSTVLKMLGGVILPNVEAITSGSVLFVPSHLKVLHIPSETYFIQDTLTKNLIFGVSAGHRDGDPFRVRSICQSLGVDEDTLHYLDTQDVLKWSDIIPQAQRQLLSLARALIANPNVLCIHKPVSVLNSAQADKVFSVFREFIDNKGLVQDARSAHCRRPRTVIISDSTGYALPFVDMAYTVSAEKGMELMASSEGKPDRDLRRTASAVAPRQLVVGTAQEVEEETDGDKAYDKGFFEVVLHGETLFESL